MHQCSQDLSYKQTEQEIFFRKKLESLGETNFSYTLDRTRVIDMGRQFSISEDGSPLGMAVTLAERQYSGIDPRQNSTRKIMLNFG